MVKSQMPPPWKPKTSSWKPRILVVDDLPDNLRLLVSLLSAHGYTVLPAMDGPTALEVARADLPDLILLDIMMPNMDGYEVCAELKSDPATQDIPVLFISALDATADKVKSFNVGGIDYVTKPFQSQEVLARVKTHLTIRQLQRDLLRQVGELDAFARMVAHDIKSTLVAINGFTDILLNEHDQLSPEMRSQYLEAIQGATGKTMSIVNELLLLARIGQTEVLFEPVNMAAVVEQACQRVAPAVSEQEAEIVLPDEWPSAAGYEPWLEEVWYNYLSNGLKYGGRPPRLELGADRQADGRIRFWLRDNGPGIRTEDQDGLFVEFFQLAGTRSKGYGLGLSIVRRIIERLGGEVGVNSQVGKGSEFYFILDRAPEPV
jgi:two-component system, sensor histidine kinase and response regulator